MGPGVSNATRNTFAPPEFGRAAVSFDDGPVSQARNPTRATANAARSARRLGERLTIITRSLRMLCRPVSINCLSHRHGQPSAAQALEQRAQWPGRRDGERSSRVRGPRNGDAGDAHRDGNNARNELLGSARFDERLGNRVEEVGDRGPELGDLDPASDRGQHGENTDSPRHPDPRLLCDPSRSRLHRTLWQCGHLNSL